MDFDSASNDDPGDYSTFVAWLTAITAESLKSAKGDEPLVRAAIAEYIRRGYAANLTSGELTDFFCADTPSVLDRAGYDGADADEAVAVYDELNSRSHNDLPGE